MSDMDSSSPFSSLTGFPLAPPTSSSSSSSSDTEEVVNHGFNRRVDVELSVFCFTVVLGFWFFVSMALIVGVYGPENLWIGPNSSILVEQNSIFVQSIKVKQLDDSNSGLELYGFYKSPPLNVFMNWSESRLLSIPHKSYKGWPYYLNKGTLVNISYSVEPVGSSVHLVVSEGAIKGVSQWVDEEDAYRNAFSWNLIEGSGMIKLKITKSSSYYVTVANMNMKDIKVELNMDVRAVLYDTTQSFYNCNFINGECTFNSMSLVGNSIVVTSPGPRQGASTEEEWYIRISYQPKWTAYITTTGAMICFMVLALVLCKRLNCCGDNGERYHLVENDSARTHLLANKDGDNSSSYESLATDDGDLEEEFIGNESDSTNRRLCAICFDSSRDCFFLPCGHCISCYQCGTKIGEGDGNCPICRRKIKKVKLIYTV